jgi:hypothetical protein
MIEYISTKDTAKLVRVALRNAFPGVRFSVRMSTATAAARSMSNCTTHRSHVPHLELFDVIEPFAVDQCH